MEKNNTKSIISDAVMIAFLTGYSYFISHLYQMGYYRYFNLPSFLVELSIENILTAIISVFGFCYVIYIIINGFTASIPNETNPYIVKIIKRYIYYFLTFGILFLIGNIKEVRLYVLVIILLGILLATDFVKPMFSQKTIKGYRNKIIAENEKLAKANDNYTYENSINSFFVKRIPFLPLLIIIIYITSTLSYNLGIYNAQKQKVFTLINNDYVILGTYNNEFIVKEIDIQQKTLEPYFYLISNQENFIYLEKQVGRLIIK